MKVVLDTNVFVSSVFGGLPRHVIELWLEGRITLCLSEPIVTEYQRVLREIGAVGKAEERALIEGVGSDPDDVKFLERALELGADVVVSGDSVLLELKSYTGIPILTPRELLEQIGEAPSK